MLPPIAEKWLGSETPHLLGEVLCGDDKLLAGRARCGALAGSPFSPEEGSRDGGTLAESGGVGERKVHVQGQRRGRQTMALGQAMAMSLNGQGRHGSCEFAPMNRQRGFLTANLPLLLNQRVLANFPSYMTRS